MIRRYGKDGQRLYKRVRFCIIVPGQARKMRQLTAPAGQGFTEEAIEDAILKQAAHLEKTLPHFDFRLVPVGDLQYNFIGTMNPDATVLLPHTVSAR